MAAIIIRIVLFTLGIGFLCWWLYITYLGLKAFFAKAGKSDNIAK